MAIHSCASLFVNVHHTKQRNKTVENKRLEFVDFMLTLILWSFIEFFSNVFYVSMLIDVCLCITKLVRYMARYKCCIIIITATSASRLPSVSFDFPLLPSLLPLGARFLNFTQDWGRM